VSRVTVVGWRSRYRDKGLAGLDDDPRSSGAAHGRAPGSRGGDPGTAAAQVRREALVVEVAGPAPGDRERDRGQGPGSSMALCRGGSRRSSSQPTPS